MAAPRNLANMTPEQIEEKVEALSPAWARDYIRRLEGLTRALATQLQAAQPAIDFATSYDPQPSNGQAAEAGTFSNGVAPVLPSVWTPAGITPPDGEYATIRVLDGQANMEPVADLPDRAEIRFADFYQVHYGGHETTGGMRLLVIEGDGPIDIKPVSQTTVLICRGGYTTTETR